MENLDWANENDEEGNESNCHILMLLQDMNEELTLSNNLLQVTDEETVEKLVWKSSDDDSDGIDAGGRDLPPVLDINPVDRYLVDRTQVDRNRVVNAHVNTVDANGGQVQVEEVNDGRMNLDNRDQVKRGQVNNRNKANRGQVTSRRTNHIEKRHMSVNREKINRGQIFNERNELHREFINRSELSDPIPDSTSSSGENPVPECLNPRMLPPVPGAVVHNGRKRVRSPQNRTKQRLLPNYHPNNPSPQPQQRKAVLQLEGMSESVKDIQHLVGCSLMQIGVLKQRIENNEAKTAEQEQLKSNARTLYIASSVFVAVIVVLIGCFIKLDQQTGKLLAETNQYVFGQQEKIDQLTEILEEVRDSQGFLSVSELLQVNSRLSEFHNLVIDLQGEIKAIKNAQKLALTQDDTNRPVTSWWWTAVYFVCGLRGDILLTAMAGILWVLFQRINEETASTRKIEDDVLSIQERAANDSMNLNTKTTLMKDNLEKINQSLREEITSITEKTAAETKANAKEMQDLFKIKKDELVAYCEKEMSLEGRFAKDIMKLKEDVGQSTLRERIDDQKFKSFESSMMKKLESGLKKLSGNLYDVNSNCEQEIKKLKASLTESHLKQFENFVSSNIDPWRQKTQELVHDIDMRFANFSKEFDIIKEKCYTSEKNVATYKQDINKFNLIQKLEEKIKNEEKAQFTKSLDGLKKDISPLNQYLSKAKTDVEAVSSKIDQMTNNCQKSTVAIEELNAKCTAFSSRLDLFDGQVKHLECASDLRKNSVFHVQLQRYSELASGRNRFYVSPKQDILCKTFDVAKCAYEPKVAGKYAFGTFLTQSGNGSLQLYVARAGSTAHRVNLTNPSNTFSTGFLILDLAAEDSVYLEVESSDKTTVPGVCTFYGFMI